MERETIMADIQWIKIKTNIFDNAKISILESMPDGDTILVIWFKLLSMAGRCNDSGLVYLVRDLPYDAETLAHVMRRPVNTVRLALAQFQKLQMIDIENDIIAILDWENHQNIDALAKMKEQSRLSSYKHREKQKLLMGRDVTVTKNDGTEKRREEKNREEKDTYFTCQYFSVLKEKHYNYEQAFPDVSIDQEYVKMKIWLDDNPKKRKTDYGRFILGWLNRIKKPDAPATPEEEVAALKEAGVE